MDSANESFTISFKQTLLDNNDHRQQQQQSSPQNQARKKNLKTIFFASLIVIIVIAVSTILITYISKTQKPKRFNIYLSNSKTYYCHLTMYPDLCYESMSETMPNIDILESKPGPIFSTSLQVAINQLKNISTHLDNTVPSSSTADHPSPLAQSLPKCRTFVHDSLSQLNESLSVLGVDPDVESLTYEELDSMKGWAVAAEANALKCYVELDGGDHHEKSSSGVERVKLGVEKARKCVVNSIGLMESKWSILNDFYNPYGIDQYDDGYYYDYYLYHYFEYRFLICLYSLLYLFLGLLYFLFWRTK